MDKKYSFTQLLPLRPHQENLLKFPTDAFPAVLKEMALAIATSTETDPAMAGTAMLSAISYCLSGVFLISAKSDHIESPVLFSLNVAEPSSKKSPVISFLKKPYTDFSKEWNEKNKKNIYQAQAERKILENKLLSLEKNDKVSADEIAKIKEELSNMPSGKLRRIIIDDITPESLCIRLQENGTLSMVSDCTSVKNPAKLNRPNRIN